jgi:SAM-dependent methyltransferase
MIEDASIPPRTYDAVFVWNCFEQIPDPARTLKSIRSVLRPHGLLVIRVPNAGFYRKRKGQTVNALAWNNLLGFPYLYGYTGDLVTRLAGRWGFEYVSGFNSELVTMPFPDLSTALAAEQKTASEVVAARSVASSARTHQLAGPWIEMVYRMVKEPVGAWRSCVDRHFLPRAA